MIQVKNSIQYYINERALTFSENDLDNPNRVAVSLVSGTVILVHVPGTIDYASDGNYERWTLKGYSTRLVNADAHYVYARLNRSDKNALIVFSVKNYNIDGSITTITGKDENGNDITETSDPSADYFFVRIGEITATDSVENPTVNRELTYDSGLLSTAKGNSVTDPNDMWELDKYSTPWLIRAKHWLTSFTLKGFLTFIGGFIFKKDGGEEKRIVDIMRTTDSGDPNDANYVPIDDTTIPTTAWVQSRSEDRYLKKYEPDETRYRIKFFDGIEAGYFVKGMIGGSGTQLDGDGYGEMNGLTLREFLEVPELRFNRIDVVSGELWNSVAFGLIEKVDTDRCIAWVKLEERERCGLHVYDICRGIFADFGDGTQWEGVDECGFLHLYGFWTSYFTPIEIIENGEGVFSFRYELKAGTKQHPTVSMKFAVYGNFVDSSRQASAYSTRTYKRYLNKVDTWVIDPDKHIYAQYGDLNGLSIGGQDMSGYGSFQSNSYFTGVQIQFTKEQKLELQGESAYSVTLSDYEGIVTIDDEGNIIGGETELLNVITGGENVVTGGENVVTAGYKLQTQVQAMRGSELLFYSPASPSEGAYTIAINSVGCTAMILNGIVVVTSVFHTERCFVNIVVNCEGEASFTQTYRITAVRDGKNPIIADIDNEMDSVACDSSGKVLFGLPVSCTVSMWAGTGKLALDRLEISAPEGVTCSADKTTGLIRVTDITQEAERTLPLNITAYASYGGTQYHKDLVFTVNKVNAGENALLYKLSPSASSVKVDDAGTMTAESIACEVVSSDGNTITTLASLPSDGSLTMQYYLDKDTAKSYAYKSAVKVGSSTKAVTFKLYWKGNLIDVETIPIIIDGSSPLIVDLDNEMQSVACDENGKVVLGVPLSTGVKAFYGSKELTITSITLGTVAGVTASVSGTTVTVTEITQAAVENIRVPITVKASHDKEYTRTVYLIVNKLKQGENAAVVDLVPSVSAIKINAKGAYTPTSVSCMTKVTTGKQGANIPAACPENYTLKIGIDGVIQSDSYSYGTSETITSAKTSVEFYLYYKNDKNETVLVDRETIPVVKDGESPVKLDLDNEMQSVSCDEKGAYRFGLPLSTGVKMYYGADELTISSLTVTAPTGVTVEKTTSLVKVTAIDTTKATAEVLNINISATASYGGEIYTKSATLTVHMLRQGDSAVVLDLAPSVTAIKVSSANAYTPTTVSCNVKQTTGKNGATTPSTLPTGYSMKYQIDSKTAVDYTKLGNTFSVTSATTGVTFFLYYNNVLVDRETIPVVKDGDPFTFDDLTDEQKEQLKGEDGADAAHYTVTPPALVIGKTMTGTIVPDNATFTCYKDTGTKTREEETAKWVVYARSSEDEAWSQWDEETSWTATFNVEFSSSYKYYKIVANPYTTISVEVYATMVADGQDGKPGATGATGAMPRYRGEFVSGTTYFYNSKYRDIVVYKGDVYQVFEFKDSETVGVTSTPTTTLADDSDDGKWQKANKYKFVAMDTALIDSANIAGFTFTRLNSDLSNPIGKLASQNGTLELNAYDGSLTCNDVYLTGEINATSGTIGGFTIGTEYMSSGDLYNGLMTLSPGALGFKQTGGLHVLIGPDAIPATSGLECGFYSEAPSSGYSIWGIGNAAFATRASAEEHTFVSGLSVCAQKGSSLSLSTAYGNYAAGNNVDFLVMNGSASLPNPIYHKGRIVFVRCNSSYTLSVPSGKDAEGGSKTSWSGDNIMRLFISDGTNWNEMSGKS